MSNRDVVHASPIVAAVGGSRRRRTPKAEHRPSETWFERAACIGQRDATFFPERGESAAAALAMCAACAVRRECLAFAIRNHERFGIWGGLTEGERRRLHLPVAATG